MCDKRNIVRGVTEVTGKPNPPQKDKSVTTESRQFSWCLFTIHK